jgi:L-serine kinase (ADP)
MDSFINLTVLKQHEKVDPVHLRELTLQIQIDGFISDPIIVDANTMVILDGHHRFNAARNIGLSRIPVQLVDYGDAAITVTGWKKNVPVSKNEVIRAGLSGNLLESKTSRHSIPKRITGIKIPLSDLKG